MKSKQQSDQETVRAIVLGQSGDEPVTSCG